jgi:pimeloyl-ACP methyl ester carboxylesterase
LAEQCRLALRPGYLEAHLSVLRALVGPFGQREVLVDRLGLLETPTLVVWGERDRVFPERQAREAVARLREGSLALIPNCATWSARTASWRPSRGSSSGGGTVDRRRRL